MDLVYFAGEVFSDSDESGTLENGETWLEKPALFLTVGMAAATPRQTWTPLDLNWESYWIWRTWWGSRICLRWPPQLETATLELKQLVQVVCCGRRLDLDAPKGELIVPREASE